MKNNRKVEKGQLWAMEGDMDDLYVILRVVCGEVEVQDLNDGSKSYGLIKMIENDVFVM